MESKKFTLTYPWDENGYKPEVEFELGMCDTGFTMHIVVQESDPRRVETKQLNFVHLDSCVEWFVNFDPEICDRYFNFEVNANGVMYVAFRKDRYDFDLLTLEDVESLGIKAQIHPDSWKISYTVPFTLMEKYIPGYQFREGMAIRANFYKCGEKTQYPHFGVWRHPGTSKPDFHRPECFGEILMK